VLEADVGVWEGCRRVRSGHRSVGGQMRHWEWRSRPERQHRMTGAADRGRWSCMEQ
jgi:hypothetical protein